MKKFWWSSIILLLCLMYFATSSAIHQNRADGQPDISGQQKAVLSQYVGGRGRLRLRPTDTMPEALTLYEQARANLAGQ